MKAGRKRKPGHREPNGRLQRLRTVAEREGKIMAVAIQQRINSGASPETAKDARWGHALGRALLHGRISYRQYAAGEVYTRRAIAYYGQITGTLPRFPSLLARMACGESTGDEVTPERAREIREAFAELEEALSDGGLLTTGGAELTRLCVRDIDPKGEMAIGLVREALNKVAHRLRLPLDERDAVWHGR